MKKLPDPAFEAEFEAAKESGFSCHLFGLDDFPTQGSARGRAGYLRLPSSRNL
jgi:hypothetical protein